MVLARKGRAAQTKQPAEEVTEMAHGWPAVGEAAGGGSVTEGGVPKAVFVAHGNSLHFEERCVSLEQPVKIGRNVYRAAPSPTNTIFECRVLSRHHATLWYEKGHFYIMDNQSSNGTFINNNRCSISKEMEPHEVYSGDVLQFGIAVVENQANQEKNTFLPVIALLKLYHPDGKEAKLTFNPAMTTPLHLKELYQLNTLLQEAVSREAALETRLRTLRECVERTRAEALSGWELLVGEQRLLARVHALEATVAAGKPVSSEKMQQLLDDKNNYQEVAQESLRQAHEQRLLLEEALDRKSREAHSLHQHNCDLRLTTNHALAELQKLAARCERKICAAKIAIAAAEEREASTRARLPLALSKVNGESRMLVVSWDSARRDDAVCRSEDSQSLVDAVRALPDYVKLLLPEHVLTQVGIKAITLDGKNAKEYELILKKNELGEVENRGKDKRTSLDECVLGWLEDNCRNMPQTAHISEDKNGTLNHDSSELSSTVLESEMNSTHAADNNANSTFHPVENHTDAPSTKSQQEYSNCLVVVAGLKEELATLRARLTELGSDNDKLRDVRDQLLSVKLEVQEELNERRMLEQAAAADADSDTDTDTEKHDPESHKELAARLDRALVSERDLAAELALRPTQQSYDTLTQDCRTLRDELRERDSLLEDFRLRFESRSIENHLDDSEIRADVATIDADIHASRETCEKGVNTATEEIELDDELSALNELDAALVDFSGDETADEETIEDDSVEDIVFKAELMRDRTEPDGDPDGGSMEVLEMNEDVVSIDEPTVSQKTLVATNDAVSRATEISSSANFHNENRLGLEEEARAVAAAEVSAVLSLQEELVRVKERWAEARAECARLQAVPRERPGRGVWLAYAAAIIATALYALLYGYVS